MVRGSPASFLEALAACCANLAQNLRNLSWRDADDVLEVMERIGFDPRIRARRDLCQGKVRSCLQELIGRLDARRMIAYWCGGSPVAVLNCRAMVALRAGDRRHLLQARAGVEVFLDVLDDGPEPPPPVMPRPALERPAGCHDVPDQVDGQEVGQHFVQSSGFPRVGPAHSKKTTPGTILP